MKNKYPISTYLWWAKNWIIMFWSKLRLFFGFNYKVDVIPEGMYCYKPDDTKSFDTTIVEEGVYYRRHGR